MQNAQNPFKQRTLGISVEGGTIFFKPRSARMREHYFVPPEVTCQSKFLVVMTVYSPNFLRISLGMAFLLMRKSMVLAAMKALVMYQMPL